MREVPCLGIADALGVINPSSLVGERFVRQPFRVTVGKPAGGFSSEPGEGCVRFLQHDEVPDFIESPN